MGCQGDAGHDNLAIVIRPSVKLNRTMRQTYWPLIPGSIYIIRQTLNVPEGSL